MATTFVNLGLVVPDQGTTPWYASLLDWLGKIDAYAGGHWAPLTNADPTAPELIFDGEADAIMVWVED